MGIPASTRRRVAAALPVMSLAYNADQSNFRSGRSSLALEKLVADDSRKWSTRSPDEPTP